MAEIIEDRVYTKTPKLVDKTDQLISTENLIPTGRQVNRKDVIAFSEKLKKKKAKEEKEKAIDKDEDK